MNGTDGSHFGLERATPTMHGSSSHNSSATAWYHRYRKLRLMLAIAVGIGALLVGGVIWMGKQVLMASPASGAPLNECARTDHHIASLIQSTDPHLPEISGRGANTTTSISILLIPLDGSRPRLIPVVNELDGVHYGLARIMGSDGRTLWFDCTGLFGVRLSDYELITTKDLREANPSVDASWWDDPRGMDITDGRLHIINADRSAAMDVDPSSLTATSVAPKVTNARFSKPQPTDFMAAGFLSAPGQWFGVHAAADLEGEFKPGKWVRSVENADDAKQPRRLCAGETEASSEGEHHRIRSMAPLSEPEYLNAAFLRMDAKSSPLRLNDPDGVLMMHTSAPGLRGTLVIARVDFTGKVVWSADTGLDRFSLRQILPGTDAFAFVGTRPQVEGKVSEPLVVLVDSTTGKLTSHTLWR